MEPEDDFTVPTDWVRDMIEVAGAAPPQLARALGMAGLHWSDVSEDGRQIGQRQEVRFLDALVKEVDDGQPGFAARLGLKMPGKTSTVVSYVKHGSRNVAEAMQAAARLLPLTRPGAIVTYERNADEAHWTLDNRDPWVWDAANYQEFVVSAVMASWQVATGRRIRPAFVNLRPCCRGREAFLAHLWGCPVQSDTGDQVIALHADTLELPLVSFDAPLLDHLRGYGELLLAQIDAPQTSLRLQVEKAIISHLSRGVPQVAEVAGDLGMSVRTLTRRLQEQELNYRAVVEDIRRRKAELMLSEGTLSLAEISFMLGYSEQSSFTNAFRRWTGQAPGAFRAARRAG